MRCPGNVFLKGSSKESLSLRLVGGSLFDLDHTDLHSTVISVFSDFFLSAFPILILRKVQISIRNKVGLCLLMGLGVITGTLCIVRTVLNGQNVARDPTWDSLPNWYWRCWEVFFGIVAACIPTLRPGYAWLIVKIRNGFIKLGSSNSKLITASTAAKKWVPPKPSAFLRASRKGTTDVSAASTREEDRLPLQNFSPSFRTSVEHYRTSDQQRQHYPADQFGNERKKGLHIAGDLSTHRPGHLKRFDSEAKVGGGLGAEEIEERV